MLPGESCDPLREEDVQKWPKWNFRRTKTLLQKQHLHCVKSSWKSARVFIRYDRAKTNGGSILRTAPARVSWGAVAPQIYLERHPVSSSVTYRWSLFLPRFLFSNNIDHVCIDNVMHHVDSVKSRRWKCSMLWEKILKNQIRFAVLACALSGPGVSCFCWHPSSIIADLPYHGIKNISRSPIGPKSKPYWCTRCPYGDLSTMYEYYTP